MTSAKEKIVSNDLLLAEYYNQQSILFRQIADNYLHISGLIKNNTQVRQDMNLVKNDLFTPTIISVNDTIQSTDTELNVMPDLTIKPILGQTPFQMVQSLFPDSTVQYVTDNRDDAFVRTVMNRMSISVEKIIAPVIKKERKIYETSDGDCLLFRMAQWKAEYKPTSAGFGVSQKELDIFNLSKFLLIARFESGSTHSSGFKDWALYNIEQLTLSISTDGKIEYRKSGDSNPIIIEPLKNDPDNPWFFLRLNNPERLIEPILQG